MKKVLHIEIIMENPILILDDKSFHLLVHKPIPIPEVVKMNAYYTERGFEYLDCSKIAELDFSGLKGMDFTIYQQIKSIWE